MQSLINTTIHAIFGPALLKVSYPPCHTTYSFSLPLLKHSDHLHKNPQVYHMHTTNSMTAYVSYSHDRLIVTDWFYKHSKTQQYPLLTLL